MDLDFKPGRTPYTTDAGRKLVLVCGFSERGFRAYWIEDEHGKRQTAKMFYQPHAVSLILNPPKAKA